MSKTYEELTERKQMIEVCEQGADSARLVAGVSRELMGAYRFLDLYISSHDDIFAKFCRGQVPPFLADVLVEYAKTRPLAHCSHGCEANKAGVSVLYAEFMEPEDDAAWKRRNRA